MIKNWLYSEREIPGSKNKNYNFQLYPLMAKTIFPLINLKFYLLEDWCWFDLRLFIFGGFINFETKWTKKRDHAGFEFSFGIAGINLIFYIYDSRHWDDEKDCWNEYEEHQTKE